jgi:phytoene desaturase (3,4-didehydrolycopene-forming)
VPICLAGAKLTTEQILRDRGQAVPWPKWKPGAEAREQEARGSQLDVQRNDPPIWLKPLLVLLLAVFVVLAVSGRGPALTSVKV